MTPARRLVLAGSLVTLLCGPSLIAPGPARAAERVDLPTEDDVFGLTVGAETILYGPKGIETLLPGPVDDFEVVTVKVGPGGVPAEVGARQRLVVHGLGDFRFKVSGPAQTVEALPGSEAQPGLRKGSVLWQGFSADRKVLSAQMLLFPDQEAIRLPLQMNYEQIVGGKATTEPASGEMSARLTLTNRSASPVTVTSAEGDPAELAGALDALAARLAAGERPRPGEAGVPAALAPVGGTKALTRSVPATFHIVGRLSFDGGRLSGAAAEGGRAVARDGAPGVRFEGFVGAGDSETMEVTLTGNARSLGRPVLDVRVLPAPPPASVARPPGGGTWKDLVASGAVDGTRAMWNRIMTISWGIAKLRQFDAYLGNPDPTGPAETEYRFQLAAPAPLSAPATDSGPRLTTTPLLLTTAILALLLLAFDGLVLWSLL